MVYVHCIMGVGRAVQWALHNTTAQLAERFDMKESIRHLFGQSRSCWLGHLAQMSDSRTPKQLLIDWLSETSHSWYQTFLAG